MNAERVGVGAVLCLIVLGVAYQMGFGRTETVSTQPDTVYLEMSKTSGAVAETTTKTVTRFVTRKDSVLLYVTDTVTLKEYIRSLDTVFVNCERCAEQLRTHRRVSDSTIKARDDTIYVLRRRLQKCAGSRPWWAVAGLGVGVVSCKLP